MLGELLDGRCLTSPHCAEVGHPHAFLLCSAHSAAPDRFVIWGGAISGFMWAPPGALEGFSQAARVFSGFFIILQVLKQGGRAGGWIGGSAALPKPHTQPHTDDIRPYCLTPFPNCSCTQLVILLEFIYAVNEWLVTRDGWCSWVLVGSTILFIVGSFVGLGFLYHFYAPEASCSLNIWFCTRCVLWGEARNWGLGMEVRVAMQGQHPFLLSQPPLLRFCSHLPPPPPALPPAA